MWEISKAIRVAALSLGAIASAWSLSRADQHYRDVISLILAPSKPVYAKGEKIELFLTLANASKEPVTLPFSSAKQYDFVIKKKDGAEVWQWSQGKMFAMILTQLAVEARKSKTLQIAWDQKDKEGKQVEPGAYEVTATLPVRGQQPLSTTVKLEIK